jgi:hypothetical protein
MTGKGTSKLLACSVTKLGAVSMWAAGLLLSANLFLAFISNVLAFVSIRIWSKHK